MRAAAPPPEPSLPAQHVQHGCLERVLKLPGWQLERHQCRLVHVQRWLRDGGLWRQPRLQQYVVAVAHHVAIMLCV